MGMGERWGVTSERWHLSSRTRGADCQRRWGGTLSSRWTGWHVKGPGPGRVGHVTETKGRLVCPKHSKGRREAWHELEKQADASPQGHYSFVDGNSESIERKWGDVSGGRSRDRVSLELNHMDFCALRSRSMNFWAHRAPLILLPTDTWPLSTSQDPCVLANFTETSFVIDFFKFFT